MVQGLDLQSANDEEMEMGSVWNGTKLRPFWDTGISL